MFRLNFDQYFLRRIVQRLVTVCPLVLTPLFAQGATYYIATTGSDNNTCAAATKLSSPKRNFTGANGAIACMSSGDILLVGNGTYAEALRDIIPAGTSGAPTTIRAINAGQVTLRPTGGYSAVTVRNYITLDGLDIDAVNLAGGMGFGSYDGSIGSYYVTFKNGIVRNTTSGIGDGGESCIIGLGNSTILNSEIHHCGKPGSAGQELDHGLYLGTGNLIEGNRIHDVSCFGMQLYAGGQSIDNNTVRNNVVYSNGCAGILVAGSNNLIYNNIIYSNGSYSFGHGVWLYSKGTGNKVYNNSSYKNKFCIAIDSGVSSADLKNNICYGNTSGAISDSGYGTVCTYNLGVSGGEGGSNSCSSANTSTNPFFVDASAANFHLQSGSPAIAHGINLYGIFVIDYDGNIRSAVSPWDMGPFTYGAPSPPQNLRVTAN